MNNYALQYLEKVKINGVRNNEENYRKYIAEKSINSKNTDGWLIPNQLLNISNRISGNKIVKANIIKKKKIIVKISKYKELLEKDYNISIMLSTIKCKNFANYLGFFSWNSSELRSSVFKAYNSSKDPLLTCKNNINQYEKEKILPDFFCKNKIDTNYFLFMNYYPLGSLEKYKPKNIDEIISIINQVLSCMTYAYEKINFVHGDLHPGNILVKKTTKENLLYNFDDKTIKISTFGVEVVLFDFDRSSTDKNFGFLLNELSTFINTYETIMLQMNLFNNQENTPFRNLKKEFYKITNIQILKMFIGNN